MQNNIFNYYSYVFNDSICIPNVYTLYENETAPRQTTTITPVSNSYNFWYMGMACKSSTSVSVQFEVTTAGGFTSTTSNYYEFLIFKGELATPLAQTSLTRLGSVSTTADVSTTGIKTVNIPMTTPIGTADEMWFAISCCAATPPVLRSGSPISTYTYYCYNITAVNTRLSAIGTDEISINGVASQAPWIVLKI